MSYSLLYANFFFMAAVTDVLLLDAFFRVKLPADAMQLNIAPGTGMSSI
jgi:hypothetical protein